MKTRHTPCVLSWQGVMDKMKCCKRKALLLLVIALFSGDIFADFYDPIRKLFRELKGAYDTQQAILVLQKIEKLVQSDQAYGDYLANNHGERDLVVNRMDPAQTLSTVEVRLIASRILARSLPATELNMDFRRTAAHRLMMDGPFAGKTIGPMMGFAIRNILLNDDLLNQFLSEKLTRPDFFPTEKLGPSFIAILESHPEYRPIASQLGESQFFSDGINASQAMGPKSVMPKASETEAQMALDLLMKSSLEMLQLRNAQPDFKLSGLQALTELTQTNSAVRQWFASHPEAEEQIYQYLIHPEQISEIERIAATDLMIQMESKNPLHRSRTARRLIEQSLGIGPDLQWSSRVNMAIEHIVENPVHTNIILKNQLTNNTGSNSTYLGQQLQSIFTEVLKGITSDSTAEAIKGAGSTIAIIRNLGVCGPACSEAVASILNVKEPKEGANSATRAAKLHFVQQVAAVTLIDLSGSKHFTPTPKAICMMAEAELNMSTAYQENFLTHLAARRPKETIPILVDVIQEGLRDISERENLQQIMLLRLWDKLEESKQLTGRQSLQLRSLFTDPLLHDLAAQYAPRHLQVFQSTSDSIFDRGGADQFRQAFHYHLDQNEFKEAQAVMMKIQTQLNSKHKPSSSEALNVTREILREPLKRILDRDIENRQDLDLAINALRTIRELGISDDGLASSVVSLFDRTFRDSVLPAGRPTFWQVLAHPDMPIGISPERKNILASEIMRTTQHLHAGGAKIQVEPFLNWRRIPKGALVFYDQLLGELERQSTTVQRHLLDQLSGPRKQEALLIIARGMVTNPVNRAGAWTRAVQDKLKSDPELLKHATSHPYGSMLPALGLDYSKATESGQTILEHVARNQADVYQDLPFWHSVSNRLALPEDKLSLSDRVKLAIGLESRVRTMLGRGTSTALDRAFVQTALDLVTQLGLHNPFILDTVAELTRNPALRLSAIRTLGNSSTQYKRHSDALVQIAVSDKNPEIRLAALRVLNERAKRLGNTTKDNLLPDLRNGEFSELVNKKAPDLYSEVKLHELRGHQRPSIFHPYQAGVTEYLRANPDDVRFMGSLINVTSSLPPDEKALAAESLAMPLSEILVSNPKTKGEMRARAMAVGVVGALGDQAPSYLIGAMNPLADRSSYGRFATTTEKYHAPPLVNWLGKVAHRMGMIHVGDYLSRASVPPSSIRQATIIALGKTSLESTDTQNQLAYLIAKEPQSPVGRTAIETLLKARKINPTAITLAMTARADLSCEDVLAFMEKR